MDLLNRAYAQLYDQYRSLTPGSRLTAGLLAAVVLLSLGYLFTHQGSSPEVDLMHGVPVAAAQLPAMEAALGKANLRYLVRGTSILVPRGQEPACMAALADAKALPQNIGDAFREAVNSGGLFEDNRQREQRYRIATQDTLAMTIREMPGIERAYVVYDVDNKPGFNKDKLITATVGVKPVGSGQLAETQVTSIRNYVAGAIAGLKPENVTISDLNGGRTWYANADDAGGGEENLYIALQRTYEQDLKTKVLNALCFIPNVTVELSVVLDRERITRIKQDRRSPAGPRRAGGDAAAKGSRASRSGSTAQRPNTATVLSALLGGSPSEAERDETEAPEVGSHEQLEKESVGLTPIQARVSVGVPISYFKKVWQELNLAESGQPSRIPSQAALDQIRSEESVKIQNHVAQLLPSRESAAKAAELVKVTTFQEIPIQEPAPPDFNQTLLSWLRQSWTTLGMIALALVSLLVLRSMVRARPVAADVQTMAVSSDLDDDLDVDKMPESREANIPHPHARRFHSAGSSLREELSEMVESDPDAAVNVLHNWIGPAGKT